MYLLKACPFCGSIDLDISYGLKIDNYYIYCWGCDTEGSIKKGKQEAVNAWNRRGIYENKLQRN